MTTLSVIKDKLLQIKPEMQQRYAVHSIGLFGSIVRDDFTDESDIDVIVDFNRPVGIEFIDLATFLESQLGRQVDLVSRKGIKPKYLRQIEEEIVYV
jgi:predicted nucleotidyltransferase